MAGTLAMTDSSAAVDFTIPLPYGAIVPRRTACSSSSSAARPPRCGCLLYDEVADREPSRIIDFDRDPDRWGDIWSVFVPGVGPGQLYHFQADGPYDPERGHRFDRQGPADRSLRQGPGRRLPAGRRRIDPAAEVRGGRRRVRLARRSPPAPELCGDDHLRDARPRLHPVATPAACKHPGTYLGVIEKIPYLQSLGVTAVELMPVHEFPTQRLFRAKSRPARTTGATIRWPSSRRTAATPPATSRAARSASSRRWSGRCTRPASK